MLKNVAFYLWFTSHSYGLTTNEPRGVNMESYSLTRNTLIGQFWWLDSFGQGKFSHSHGDAHMCYCGYQVMCMYLLYRLPPWQWISRWIWWKFSCYEILYSCTVQFTCTSRPTTRFSDGGYMILAHIQKLICWLPAVKDFILKACCVSSTRSFSNQDESDGFPRFIRKWKGVKTEMGVFFCQSEWEEWNRVTTQKPSPHNNTVLHFPWHWRRRYSNGQTSNINKHNVQ